MGKGSEWSRKTSVRRRQLTKIKWQGGANFVKMSQKNTPGRGNRLCKDPVAGSRGAGVRNRQKAVWLESGGHMGKNGVSHVQACSRRALKAKAGNLNSILSMSGRCCSVLRGGVSDEICSQRPLWLLCGGWQVDGQ